MTKRWSDDDNGRVSKFDRDGGKRRSGRYDHERDFEEMRRREKRQKAPEVVLEPAVMAWSEMPAPAVEQPAYHNRHEEEHLALAKRIQDALRADDLPVGVLKISRAGHVFLNFYDDGFSVRMADLWRAQRDAAEWMKALDDRVPYPLWPLNLDEAFLAAVRPLEGAR